QELKVPSAHRLSHRPQRLTTDAGRKVHVDPPVLVDRFPRPKRVAEKRELDGWMCALSIDVLAAHNPRFLRMQLESARSEPLAELSHHQPSLHLAFAVNHAVVRVATKPYAPHLTAQPRVERIVQEEVRQQRTHDAPLRSAPLARNQCFLRA